MVRTIRALGLAALLVGAALPAMAEDEAGWSYQLAHDVMSPWCPGLTLSDCPSPNAAALREWIIEQERSGLSREAVEAQLFEQFGDGLLQAPRAEGVGLVAYAIPVGGALAGAALVVAVIRRRRLAGTAAAPAEAAPRAGAAASDDELEREIDREIDREIGD